VFYVGSDLCEELITRSHEFYRVCVCVCVCVRARACVYVCLIECDLETSKLSGLSPIRVIVPQKKVGRTLGTNICKLIFVYVLMQVFATGEAVSHRVHTAEARV
jgi:hypothetical protein